MIKRSSNGENNFVPDFVLIRFLLRIDVKEQQKNKKLKTMI